MATVAKTWDKQDERERVCAMIDDIMGSAVSAVSDEGVFSPDQIMCLKGAFRSIGLAIKRAI